MESLSHEALARFVSILQNEAKIRYSKASGGIGIQFAIMALMTGKRWPNMKVKFIKRALAKLDALGGGDFKVHGDLRTSGQNGCMRLQEHLASRCYSKAMIFVHTDTTSALPAEP